MKPGGATVTDPVAQHLPAALVRLSVLAAQELTSHTRDDALCVICGTAWPFERAEMAEHNLALL